MLYSELRLLGGSAEQDGWPDRNANRSAPIWNSNAFSHHRHTACKYSGTAHPDHHEGCWTRNNANSSWDVHTSERRAANNAGAHNPGNYAANEHDDSEHPGRSRSLHHGPNPQRGTEWSNRNRQWLESGFSFAIVDAGLNVSKSGSGFHRFDFC